jgi:hypothetical protein
MSNATQYYATRTCAYIVLFVRNTLEFVILFIITVSVFLLYLTQTETRSLSVYVYNYKYTYIHSLFYICQHCFPRADIFPKLHAQCCSHVTLKVYRLHDIY